MVNSSELLARICTYNGGNRKQTLREHVLKVAQYASERLKSVGLYNCAYLAALMHDLGKASDKWQRYLTGTDNVKGTVIHTFHGVIYLMERYHTGREPGIETLCCEITNQEPKKYTRDI